MAEQKKEPIFALQRIYLKDASLELPNAPKVFLEQEAPHVDISLAVAHTKVEDTIYEATVRVTLTTKVNDKTLYLIEAEQAAIFAIENIPEDQLDPLLNIVCPQMIYPYLRANVADLITRASLPPLHLAEVNFQGLYEQKLAADAAEQDKKTEDKKLS
ncbi:protein-export chaperone SecB [Basilea psittacipulmonis]|uniref:Protein-export protein SecB n=1 Tax=Basilea psittacipulmonis DSM 24701 TaxID=1072685 RepID=A0A077DB35_9BURK|nr:protein-export chaperone SecB [Basilea psittacipulmonis]AIL32095.1 preprotein translocase subunit SecB [Basilea psittacipulmonis DSM 24701]